MHSPQALLEQIGFDHHQSTVYLHVLRRPDQPASVIAQQLRLPRSTVRGVLDQLCANGVMTKVYRRNTQYYACKSPKALVAYQGQKVEQAHEHLRAITASLPQFSTMFASPQIVPKVQVFTGPKEVIEAFNHSLYVDGISEILFMTSYRFLRDPVIKKNDFDFYIPRRVKKGISMRVLVGQADLQDVPKRDDKREKRERRTLSTKHMLLGNVHIYGNYVAYFSAGEQEYLAIVVESAIMANTLRSVFEALWEQARK